MMVRRAAGAPKSHRHRRSYPNGCARCPRHAAGTNQPDGFGYPGCAWPDKEHKSTFQFCENGAKAVTWEATSKRVTAEFLAANTVTSLLARSDFELEGYGRLTHPLAYDKASDTLRPVMGRGVYPHRRHSSYAAAQ
jgi:hypothetical protein